MRMDTMLSTIQYLDVYRIRNSELDQHSYLVKFEFILTFAVISY